MAMTASPNDSICHCATLWFLCCFYVESCFFAFISIAVIILFFPCHYFSGNECVRVSRQVMASGGETCAPAEDERGVLLDIDDVHLLLQGQS